MNKIWENGSLRPALEDLLGAGAIISNLTGTRSPNASAAEIIFQHHHHNIFSILENTGSGKELIHRGFPQDIEIAAQLNISDCVPVLKNQAYIAA